MRYRIPFFYTLFSAADLMLTTVSFTAVADAAVKAFSLFYIPRYIAYRQSNHSGNNNTHNNCCSHKYHLKQLAVKLLLFHWQQPYAEAFWWGPV